MADAGAFVRSYLDAIAAGTLVVEDWYTPDALQIEWPNKITPNGAERNLGQIREAEARGRQIVERQSYEVTSLIADGDRVAVEAIFRASFRMDLPDLPKGSMMEARFAIFFELAGGKIRRHRTYDCFMPPA